MYNVGEQSDKEK